MTTALALPPMVCHAGRRYELAEPSVGDPVARSVVAAYRSHAVLVPRAVTREVRHESLWGNTKVEKVVETLPDSKETLFADHHVRQRQLASGRKAGRRLLDAVCRHAGITEAAPFPDAPPGLVTDFTLAEQPLPAVKARLEESLTHDREALAFSAALHAMATGERPAIGWDEFSKADTTVCHFYFPRYGTDQRQENRRT